MLRVGLTGGVASGKSTVAKMMEARGAYLIQADLVAHELMKPGESVYDEVVKRFGQSIINKNDLGAIDRKKLGAIAFGEGRIAELNEIVHPAVIRRQDEWMAEIGIKDPNGIAVVEAALILEAAVSNRFDKLVVVTCQLEERLRRFVDRAAQRGMDAETGAILFQQIAAAQMPEDAKIQAADFLIDNSGLAGSTETQVDAVMIELRPMAATK